MSRGGQREWKAGSLHNFFKKFCLQRGPEAWVTAEGVHESKIFGKTDAAHFCADGLT